MSRRRGTALRNGYSWIPCCNSSIKRRKDESSGLTWSDHKICEAGVGDSASRTALRILLGVDRWNGNDKRVDHTGAVVKSAHAGVVVRYPPDIIGGAAQPPGIFEVRIGSPSHTRSTRDKVRLIVSLCLRCNPQGNNRYSADGETYN